MRPSFAWCKLLPRTVVSALQAAVAQAALPAWQGVERDVFADSLRMLLLILTEPNSSWNDFGSAIGRLLPAIAKLMRYRRRSSIHSERLRRRARGRGSSIRISMSCWWCQVRILSQHSSLYITQEEWASMWGKALCAAVSASLYPGDGEPRRGS
jgi:hypothetical protein